MSSTASFAPRKKRKPAAKQLGGGESKLSTPPAQINFKRRKNDGVVIQNVEVQLVFWGTAWDDSSVRIISDAVDQILKGPYMSALKQYGNIEPGKLVGHVIVKSELGNSPPNPPTMFSDKNIETLITDLIDTPNFPQPGNKQMFYCVFLPTNVSSLSDEFCGKHFFFKLGQNNVHYAWVISGTHEITTARFSHELVETVTDPEGTGFRGDPDTCNQTGWCEIADVCKDTAVVNGVTVVKYFSQVDQKCIAPGA